MWLVDEVVEKAAPVAPPAAVAGMSVMGVSLQDWVYIATLVYIAIQIANPAVKWAFKKWRGHD
ncbi:putative holin [Aeromonas phage ZPAH7B]|uniref:Putative holin n=2 Tax=Aerosvirus ZPAH7 TaxID=2733366 RepID=A0A3Q9GFI2_9CAUD|nr:holin [Aeromonas phage ZPAH7]AZQ96387.1 putative holin [Aeromonas phage ZPAH7]QAX95967.1 putative holin [Aeromonas phage ZPAH7B]